MDKTKYDAMEPILQLINANYISLPPETVRRNNIILLKVLEGIVSKMRRRDSLFNSLYKEKFFGGSYYDGLKVGSPDEFDIDLLLMFPTTAGAKIQISNKPGYVYVFLQNNAGFERFFENGSRYLSICKVLRWMEGVIQLALNELPRTGSWYSFRDICDEDLYGIIRKGGPAFTLQITGQIDGQTVDMAVDLVPCFKFDSNMWPPSRFRQNPYHDSYLGDFFIVPKCPRSVSYPDRFWRLSFQKQERELLIGKLKPAVKLLKKMRDSSNHVIASYYIKTVALWESDKIQEDFWIRCSLSYIFMHLLKEYKACLSNQIIPYFWYRSHNLLEAIGHATLVNINNQLEYIIRDIENNPPVVAKYLLTKEEYEDLFNEEIVEETVEPASGGGCTIL